VFSLISEVVENPVGRSWFFTSVGLEAFPHKNLVFTISSTSFRGIFVSGHVTNSLSEQGFNLFSRKLRKFDNTIHPLSCVCALSFLSTGIIAGPNLKD